MSRAALRAGLLQVCALALGLISLAPQQAAATDWPAHWSVVQIRCTYGQRQSQATGFVWSAPGRVVTALHSVAGCQEIVVWSELRRRETLARVINVDLEADLALLQLDNDLDLRPVPHAVEPPDVRARFFAWGYPTAAAEMIELSIEFAGGLNGGTTTLGRAFRSQDLNRMFREQAYPNAETQILRTPSPIQPGKSGAPIFDSAGRVVAIVDGGLLEGLRLVNWTIPAYVYLSDLPRSTDPAPERPSAWSGLFSAIVPDRAETVVLAAAEPPETPPVATAPGALTFVGRLPLTAAGDRLGLRGEDGMVREIEFALGDPAAFAALAFDIYEDRASGATWAIPSTMGAPSWNPDLNEVGASNASGAITLVASVRRAEDFVQAVEQNLEAFIAHTSTLATWHPPAGPMDLEFDAFDETAETAAFTGAFAGRTAQGVEVEVILHLAAAGPVTVASAVTTVLEDDLVPEADFIDYRMAEFAARFLTADTDRFRRTGLASELLTVAATAAQPAAALPEILKLPAPEGLVYTGRINLRAFAEAEGLDGAGTILADIEELVNDPAAFDALAFDIYEDKEVHAIYAVPSGSEIEWDSEFGFFVGAGPAGTTVMIAEVREAASFDDAIREDVAAFVEAAAMMADWDGPAPTDFRWDEFDAAGEFASHVGAYAGRDIDTGEEIEAILSLTAVCCTAVSTSTFVTAQLEGLGRDDLIDLYMMEFGARFLTRYTPAAIADRYYRHLSTYGPGGLGYWSVQDLIGGAPVPQPEALTLARQVSMAQVLPLLKAEGEVDLIAELRALVPDPAAFEALAFEVFEDRSSGATLAVPVGFGALRWNDATGVVEAANARGTVRLAASVRRAGSFAEAVLRGGEAFVGHVDALADWRDGTRPAAFAHDYVDTTEQYSDFYGVYAGRDRATGKDAELVLGVNTSGAMLIATSVYAVWDDAEFVPQDRLDYLLMQVATEYLTQFPLR
jgi:hypothetical protein